MICLKLSRQGKIKLNGEHTMRSPIISQGKADAVALGILVVGISIIGVYQAWWPWILIVLGCATIARQFLRGRLYDMYISFIVFGGLFFYFLMNVRWDVLMPIIFIIGAIYILFREFFVSNELIGEEKLEDTKIELDDDRPENE